MNLKLEIHFFFSNTLYNGKNSLHDFGFCSSQVSVEKPVAERVLSVAPNIRNNCNDLTVLKFHSSKSFTAI